MGARYILALVLMIGVMIGWSLIFGNRFVPEQNDPSITEQIAPSDTPEGAELEKKEEDSTDSDLLITPQESPDDPEVHVKTTIYDITFNEKLAIAKQWKLVEKNEKGDLRFLDRSDIAKDVPLNLIPETALNCLALRFGNTNLQIDFVGAKWQADKPQGIQLSDTQQEGTLTFTTTIGKQLKVAKQLTFYNDSYTVDLALTFENVSDASEPLRIGGNEEWNGYELRWGPGINADLLVHEKKRNKRDGFDKNAEGAKTYIGEGKPTKKLKDENASANALWAGISSKYFSALMIPDPQLKATYTLDTAKVNETTNMLVAAPTETAVLTVPLFKLSAQQKQTHAFRLYIGPKDDALLKSITAPNAPENSIHLSKIIDFGFFSPVAWAMLWVVNGLHNIFRNYGIAIILMTALVKVISFPLTRKAHVSMKKMSDLQPQLTELREKYRDDPQKLNKATMRIYKENGVNPLGGCIPWLPQLPIFLALYALLRSAVELRGAPFLFWIDDLSAPDTLFKLPFTIPLIFIEIDSIRFLPLLNGLTAWLQQKFVGGMSATPTTSNTQAKIMQFLPLIFVFMFYNWASGFVLYWLCNSVFTVAQQQIQTKFFHDGETDKQENTPRRKQN
ncbi:MAG: membrane protein insertase YidC [Candidatus Poribacteria bacterium]|nr:membrane protein insertase YidC [Candidatus Poribacteria bacterium]